MAQQGKMEQRSPVLRGHTLHDPSLYPELLTRTAVTLDLLLDLTFCGIALAQRQKTLKPMAIAERLAYSCCSLASGAPSPSWVSEIASDRGTGRTCVLLSKTPSPPSERGGA